MTNILILINVIAMFLVSEETNKLFEVSLRHKFLEEEQIFIF